MAGKRKRFVAFARSWRAGAAPGLRPEADVNTVSTKTDAPRGGFPEACVGWRRSRLAAVASELKIEA
jgi:hypothetical protein